MTRELPFLFVAGFPKSGTSSLFNWLSAHPEVTGATQKETCFFADPGSHVYRPDFNVLHGSADFQSAFPTPTAETRLLVEATPTHVYSQRALASIPKLPARCLFILREPASQIRSSYDYFRNNWTYIPADLTFADYLAATRYGTAAFGGNELAERPEEHADYMAWLDPWRAALGADRMKVTTFDRLKADPQALMEEIAAWCGLSSGFFNGYDFPTENESYQPRNRTLQQLNVAVRAHLPGGRLYDGARWLYRRMNTRKPDRTLADPSEAELRSRFAPMTARLAEDYDLDLSRWAP